MKSTLANLICALLFIVINNVAEAQVNSEHQKQVVLFDSLNSEGTLQGFKGEERILTNSPSIKEVIGSPKVVVDNGKSSNRIDIVFLGDGYQNTELSKFSDQVTNYSSGIISQEPFLDYSNYFNFHRVDLPSNDSGVDNDNLPGSLKDTVLDTEFSCQGRVGTLCTNVSKAWSYAALARDFDHIVVLANSSSQGSAAYPFSNLSVVSAQQQQNIDSVLHQLGHSFGNLADEYDSGPWPTYTGFEPAEPNVSAQNKNAMISQGIKWVKWLGKTSLGSIVDTHEGAMGHQYSIYRPTLTSKMRELSAPFNGPSAESIIKQIYRKVKPIDDATSSTISLSGQNTIFVKPIKTRSSSVKTEWFIDGNSITAATGDTLRPNDYPLSDGVHVVTAKVIDKTPWLMDEEFRSTYMTEIRSWNVLVDQNTPVITSHPRSISKLPGEFAQFSVVALGDDIKYQWYRNGVVIPNATTNLFNISPVARANNNDQIWVVVSNVAGSVTSNIASLTVANRVPIYSGAASIDTYRESSAGLNFSVFDSDSDILTVKAELSSAGISSGARVAATNSQLDLVTGRNYVGTYNVVLTISDGISDTKASILVNVMNRVPIISSVPTQTISWNQDRITLDLNATDQDPMDNIVYSASLITGLASNIQLRLAGNKLTIDPPSGYVGQFVVAAQASDTRAQSNTQFTVNWANGAPSLAPISDQRMFYKRDSISFPIESSDPNGDPLVITSRVISGSTSVLTTVNNNILTINPPNLFQGVAQIEVKAFDGNLSTTRTFNFESYNSSPVISNISNQNVGPLKKSLTVPFTYSDPDTEDTVQVSASLNGVVNQPINVNISGNNIIITSSNTFSSPFSIKVQATDGNKIAERIFSISVSNNIPTLNLISDQRIQPKLEDIRTITLSGIDADDDALTYTAVMTSKFNERLAILNIEGNVLKINPINDFLGNFDVKVEVSDGLSKASQTFNVITYNNAPEISPICDRSVSSSEFPLNIPISVTDKDSEDLEYEIEINPSNIAFELDSKYNFSLVEGSRSFNLFGKNEKYLRGRVNGISDRLLFILPTGGLYISDESFEKSTLIESVPTIFYNDPKALINAQSQNQTPLLSASIENSTLKINQLGSFTGLASIRIRARDSFTFDEESFILGKSTNDIQIGTINPIRMHWKEDKKEVIIPVLGSNPNFNKLSARFSPSKVALELDRQYQFVDLANSSTINSVDASPPNDNKAGRQEKYFIGKDTETNTSGNILRTTVFAIVPDGTIYKCNLINRSYSINESTKIGQVDSIYYNNLDLLFSPPGDSEPNIGLSLSQNKLLIDPADNFLGKAILEIGSMDGYANQQNIIVERYNNKPLIAPVSTGEYSWRTRTIRLPISSSDPDVEDNGSEIKNYSIQSSVSYSILDKYDLRPDSPIARRYNTSGWREMRLSGRYEGRNSEYAILPSGALYADWSGSPNTSKLVEYVNTDAYLDTTLIDGRKWSSDFLQNNALRNTTITREGNEIVLKIPDNFNSNFERISIVGQANDGLSVGESSGIIALKNTSPDLADIPTMSMHWRETTAYASIGITDIDGSNDVMPNILTTIEANQNNGIPARLQLSGSSNIINATLKPGAPRSYSFQVKAYDVLGMESQKYGALNIINTKPVLSTIGNKIFNYNNIENKISIVSSDSDSLDQNNIRIMVFPGTPAEYAPNLALKYKLALITNVTDPIGSNETHLMGEYNGQQQRFILLQNGALYKWDGGFEPDKLLGFFPDRNRLITNGLSKTPTIFSSATAEVSAINKNEIIFNRNVSPVSPSSQKFTVYATDGVDFTSEVIDVKWEDSAPVLPTQTSISGHWRNGALSMSGFPTTDADGDQITYTLTSLTNTGSTQQIINNNLVVTPRPFAAFSHIVSVEAKSTNYTVTRSYTFNFTNQSPTFSGLTSIDAGYKENLSIPINVSDPNLDPTTLSILAQGSNISSYKFSILNNILTVVPNSANPVPGVVTVNLIASDSASSTNGQLLINFRNRSPVISSLPALTMKWSERTRSIPVTVTDPDNDPITFSSIITPNSNNSTITFTNNNLNLVLNKYVAGFSVTVVAKDQMNTVSTNFPVSVSNASPNIVGLPLSRSVHWRTDSITVPITTNDLDGDQVIMSTKLIGAAFPAIPKIVGSNLIIDLPEKKVGNFIVEVSVDDGAVLKSSQMAVEVTNQAPKLAELSNIIISETSQSTSIDLEASDPNNDPITVTAQLLIPAQIAFELDKVNDFYASGTNFNFNKLGNAEKYLKGKPLNEIKEQDYVIYPNGRIYIWRGALSSSTYLGTIPSEYYLDPNKLINVPNTTGNVTGISISVSNGKLILTPNSSFSGSVWIKASVTDTRSSVDNYFSVTLDNPAEANDPLQCTTTSELFDGEYQSNSTSLFTAEGRIGDSSTGAGARTFEIDLSKSTSGPFLSGETNNYVWISGRKAPFSITYDPDTKVANFTLDGKSVAHTVLSPISLSDILIRARRANETSSLNISDLKLNGLSINNSLLVNNASSQVRVLKIRSVTALNKKFTLEGSATMSFVSGIKNSELAFQISFVKSTDAPSSCNNENDDEHDDDIGTGKKVTICHIPNGDFSKAKTLSIGKSALEAHLRHGDIIGECPGQPNDPGDPTYGGGSCEQKQIFTSPNYTLWTSFLKMINILELTNSTSTNINVKISFYSILGVLADQRTVMVRANSQFDVIMNEFSNFVIDSYGIVKLEFEGSIDGRMSYYRPSTDGAGYDFAYSIPLTDATFGTTAVGFNTFQPSMKPNEVNNQVANWLSIVNLDSAARVFTIMSYNTAGTLIMRREIEVPSFGRADVDGGHGIAGPNVVGYHKVIPKNVSSEYIAQLTRFGGDAPAGFAPSKFKFAVPLSSKLGQSDPIYIPISRKFGETNWIEVVNILDKEVGASINYYAKSGALLESVDARIAPNAQLHFNATEALSAGDIGYATVVPFEPFSIIATSMGYLREAATGSVTSIYGSQARRAMPCAQSGSYNLYLGMENWLLVANSTNNTVEAKVVFSGPNTVAEKVLLLSPRSSSYIQIHGNAELKTAPDTYGLIAVYPKDPTVRLFSEVIRVKYRANGNPDFSMPVPVR